MTISKRALPALAAGLSCLWSFALQAAPPEKIAALLDSEETTELSRVVDPQGRLVSLLESSKVKAAGGQPASELIRLISFTGTPKGERIQTTSEWKNGFPHRLTVVKEAEVLRTTRLYRNPKSGTAPTSDFSRQLDPGLFSEYEVVETGAKGSSRQLFKSAASGKFVAGAKTWEPVQEHR